MKWLWKLFAICLHSLMVAGVVVFSVGAYAFSGSDTSVIWVGFKVMAGIVVVLVVLTALMVALPPKDRQNATAKKDYSPNSTR